MKMTVHQFVSKHLTEGSLNYHDESARLLRLIPEEDRDEYLRQALVGLIGDVARRRARTAMDGYTETREGDETTGHAKPIDASSPSSSQPKQEQNLKRQDRHRSWWKTLLDETTPVLGGRKRIGDMNAADLDEAIRIREDMAAQNLASADRLRHLLKLVQEEGVAKVDDIQKIPASL